MARRERYYAPRSRRHLLPDRRDVHADPRHPVSRLHAVGRIRTGVDVRDLRHRVQSGVLRRHSGVGGLLLYLGLGWVGSFSTMALARFFGWPPLGRSFGARSHTPRRDARLLEMAGPVPGVVGPHELFHLFVLAGVTWHFVYIWRLVPLRRAMRGLQWLEEKTRGRRSATRIHVGRGERKVPGVLWMPPRASAGKTAGDVRTRRVG